MLAEMYAKLEGTLASFEGENNGLRKATEDDIYQLVPSDLDVKPVRKASRKGHEETFNARLEAAALLDDLEDLLN